MSDEKRLNTFIQTPEELKGAKTPTYIEKIESRVTPIFDAEMGSRMEIVRVKMLLTQTELAELLGTNQQQISKLERGHLEIAPFTLARLRAVFGTRVHFILFGTGEPTQWNVGFLRSKFFDEKMRIKRKPGSGLWLTEQQKSGKPYWWVGKWKKKDEGSK